MDPIFGAVEAVVVVKDVDLKDVVNCLWPFGDLFLEALGDPSSKSSEYASSFDSDSIDELGEAFFFFIIRFGAELVRVGVACSTPKRIIQYQNKKAVA